jgi:hypothetical protein
MKTRRINHFGFGIWSTNRFCVIVFYLFGYLIGFGLGKVRTPFAPHPKEKSDFLKDVGIRRKVYGIEGCRVDGSTPYLVNVPLVVSGPQRSCVHRHDVLAVLR